MKNKKIVVIEELKKLEKENGLLRPKDVVMAAKPANSPLHNFFDWNDTTAAQKYRIWQARKLIASVKVEIMEEETDAYWNAKIEIDDVPIQGYFPMDKVLNNDQLYQIVLKEAIRELNYWYTKYKHLKELKGLIDEAKFSEIKQIIV